MFNRISQPYICKLTSNIFVSSLLAKLKYFDECYLLELLLLKYAGMKKSVLQACDILNESTSTFHVRLSLLERYVRYILSLYISQFPESRAL